ncbi:MAG TPA: hypothetical protein VHG72_18340 [Polyangia bacterium]|nr:hypothetical protein [Polyangia bacterium]
MLTNRHLALLGLLTLCGCPNRNSDPEPDAGGAGGTAGAAGRGTVDPAGGAGGAAYPAGGAGGESPKLPAPDAGAANLGGKPIAEACAANSECASGFCVDSVCCSTICDGQCSICNPPGALGYCTARLTGDDTTSSDPCTGAHTCSIAIAVLNLPACRLKDLQACKVNADCASLNCVTFYVDHDGDGYGETNTTIQFCEEPGAAPPTGYVAQGGDCCDSDANAFPGQTKYFTAADGCGSWDFNCDGAIEAETSVGAQLGTVASTECGAVGSTGQLNSRVTTECH